jgi:hypothetical protein
VMRPALSPKTTVSLLTRERDGSASLGKFGLCTSAGVTVTSSPIVSSMAAETSWMAARQLSSGNSIIVPQCAPVSAPWLGCVALPPGPCMLVPSRPFRFMVLTLSARLTTDSR